MTFAGLEAKYEEFDPEELKEGPQIFGRWTVWRYSWVDPDPTLMIFKWVFKVVGRGVFS
jgi:hypothetical protein